MKQTLPLILVLALATMPANPQGMPAALDPASVQFIQMKDVKWEPSEGGGRAMLFGDPAKPGPYAYLIRWDPGQNSQPHSHSEDRYSYVISGTWWTSTARTPDKNTMVAVPAGSFVKHTANEVHWDGAREETTVIYMTGIGPVKTTRATANATPPAATTAPADYPHDMSAFGCTHRDEDHCDQAPAEPPDYYPLVGQWVRYSLLRNGFSVQPPDPPLYVMFTADGYWSMMEFPAGRPKVAKPLAQQSAAELHARFDFMAGGWGNYSSSGQTNYRHHKNGLGPGDGQTTQVRDWRFEGNVLVLEGNGPGRTPSIRARKLPRQLLASKALAGAWERTSHVVDGMSRQGAPERFLFGEDGWFQATTLPPGRVGVQGRPMAQWTPQQFVAAFGGTEASRGTYTFDGQTLARRHIGDVDPNLEGRISQGALRLSGATFSWEGIDAAGRKFRSEYRKLPPFDVFAPLPAAP